MGVLFGATPKKQGPQQRTRQERGAWVVILALATVATLMTTGRPGSDAPGTDPARDPAPSVSTPVPAPRVPTPAPTLPPPGPAVPPVPAERERSTPSARSDDGSPVDDIPIVPLDLDSLRSDAPRP